ncbi:MAG: Type 1 glutamine amidotransferase-like domain-containing protein [Bacillota bacterium]
MRRLFLHGGTFDNFEATSAPFVEAAGGRSARIGLLFTFDWEPYLDRYRLPFLALGAAEVEVICPPKGGGALDAAALERIRSCTGLYMGGGDTRQYHAIYARGEARAAVREAYWRGIPFGGFSAGALIAPAQCTIWGDRLTTPTNKLCLRGSEDGCEDELLLGDGLGLIRDCLVEAHFSELGGFPRLVAAMERRPVRYGLGIDNPICLEIRDEQQIRVHGQGRAYVLERREGGGLGVTVLEPNQRHTL